MRSAFQFRCLMTLAFCLSATVTQGQLNPATQIAWPACSGSNQVYSIVTNSCIASGTAANPAGTNGQVQYNASGVFGAYTPTALLNFIVPGASVDGSANVTLPHNFTVNGLGTFSTVAASPTLPSAPTIDMLGDSLIQAGQGNGPKYAPTYYLQRMLTPASQVRNLGWSGYTAQNLSVIIGAVTATTVGGGTIPACVLADAQAYTCSPATVTLAPQPIQGFAGAASYLYGTLAGVQGYYSYSGGVYQFTPVQVTSGTSFAAGAAFQTGQVDAYGNWTFPATPYNGDFILAAWGRNDIFTTGACGQIQLADSALSTDSHISGYIFSAIENANTPLEWSGASRYNTIVACNAARKSTWAASGHYVQDGSGNDSREQMVQVGAAYLANLPSGVVDPITQADVNHSVPPTWMHSVYANVNASAQINPGDTTVVLNVFGPTDSLTAESPMELVIDTGSNVEAMEISGCTGTGPYTCNASRGGGWGGTVTTHTASTKGIAYSEIHKTGAQFPTVPWMIYTSGAFQSSLAGIQGGYYASALIWANAYAPFAATSSKVVTQVDLQQAMQNMAIRPQVSRYTSSGQLTETHAAALYIGDPRYSTFFEQASDGYGSVQTPNNFLCKYPYSCSLGATSGSTPLPWANIYGRIMYFYAAGQTTANWQRIISGGVSAPIDLYLPRYHSGTFLAGGEDGSGNGTLTTGLYRDSACSGTTTCALGALHAGFPVYVEGADATSSTLVRSNGTGGATNSLFLPAASGGTLQIAPTSPVFGGMAYQTAAGADGSGTAQITPNATTVVKVLAQSGNGTTPSAPSWITNPSGMNINFLSTSTLSPAAATAYNTGIGSAGTAASTNIPWWIAPRSGIVTSFSCFAQVGGTKGAAGDTVNCSLYDATSSAVVTGTTVSVATTATTNFTTETTSTDAITAGHKYVIQVQSTNGSWTTAPTTVSFAGTAYIQ